MREPIWITLPDWVIEYADNVAALRQATAFFNGRQNANGLTGSFDELLWFHRRGTRCEAVGKLYMNPIVWHAFAERITGLPDLGDFIDVKGRRLWRHKMLVQLDDEDNFAFLSVCSEQHPDYAICGWLWGHEAKNDKFRDDPVGGRPAYFVPQKELRDPEELRLIIHPPSVGAPRSNAVGLPA
jgi:hypothetical protein